MQIYLNSLSDTEKFARILAPHLQVGDVVRLEGDLGAGKTTLARFIINSLTKDKTEVTSPTFNLVHLYDTDIATIWHFDLYRLKSASEIIEIGLDEALDYGITIIEWSEKAEEYLPDQQLLINLSSSNNEKRVVELKASGKWQQIIESLSIE